MHRILRSRSLWAVRENVKNNRLVKMLTGREHIFSNRVQYARVEGSCTGRQGVSFSVHGLPGSALTGSSCAFCSAAVGPVSCCSIMYVLHQFLCAPVPRP